MIYIYFNYLKFVIKLKLKKKKLLKKNFLVFILS